MSDTLAPPTIVDLIDAVVVASNNLVIWEGNNRAAGTRAMTESAWGRLVEADFYINTVQDSVYEHTLGTDVNGQPVES